MFLKSIDLFGFKSFADRSHIEFTDGISALIGPNGCGKSNVVDAVKWVLGEQASRSLRAERMEDIIFNGTDSRKAVNVADVSLTLQNDGVLPLDIPEIVVRRRLFRSGESEYSINGALVKLKDVRELFYDTGIGKSAYSIMEQGKIDQILSTRPEDRRALFEEAAGITRYKVRAREADRKLERTEANMHEIDSVLAEVRKRYETLRRQAEKTAEYRTLRDRLFEREVDLHVARLAESIAREAVLVEKSQAAEEERSTVKRGIDEINERLESELLKVNEMERTLVEVQRKLYGVSLEKSSRTDRIALLREQRGTLEERITAERGRMATLEAKRVERAEAATGAREAAVATRAEIEKIAIGTGDVEERIRAAQGRQQEARNAVRAGRERQKANAQRVSECQSELREVTEQLVAVLDSELRRSDYSVPEHEAAESELGESLAALRIALTGRRDALSDRSRLDAPVDELAKAVGSAFDALQGALERVERAAERVRLAAPRFLDQLLAPEGTITRKRALDDEVERLHTDSAAVRTREEELNRDIEHLQETIDEERATLEQMRLNRVQLEGRLAGEEGAIRRLEREERELTDQLKELSGRIAAEERRITDIDTQTAALRAEYEALESEEKRLGGERTELERAIADDNRALRGEETQLKEQMQRLAQAQTRLEEAHVRLAEKRAEVRGLYDSFSERHGRDLREFAERVPAHEGDQKLLREEIAEVRGQLKELGSVNLMAVEEFEEVRDRYEFLSTQLGDLKKAREDLIAVTAEIKRESQELFIDTYNRIRKNFHTIFRRLFGGGRAELRLADPDAVLDSGIEILVQPPGKKLENIALLSGGERSMTAVALLFATFMVRPAPFTLLDEIDAALDEHNVGRFVTMLHEFAGYSQFIVITHNKKTVAGANTLLGVTMEESGVSRVVTVRIDGARADAAADSKPAPVDPDPVDPDEPAVPVAPAGGDER